MNDRIELSVFPSTKSEALAMLYLQNQDLSKLTPTQIFEEYQKAYFEICQARKKSRL